jgi:hypothetical protein
MEVNARLTADELVAVRDAVREAIDRIVDARDRSDPRDGVLVSIGVEGFPFGTIPADADIDTDVDADGM